MKKRLCTWSLVVALLFALGGNALAAGFGNFQKVNLYQAGQFTDLKETHWAYENVKSSFEYDLLKGESETLFTPDASLTVGATIAMAARLHSIYQTGKNSFEQGTPWYACYVDYALKNGLITGEYSNYDAQIQRWEFSQIMGRALPDQALPVINNVEDSAVPDVAMTLSFAPAVYRLYRAGILTGSDGGAFAPYDKILRSEAAAILSRMVDSSLRKTFTLKVEPEPKKNLTANQVFERSKNSVFYLELYDENGEAFASGSGVFLTSSGVAVTNYHVIEGGQSACIRTYDGTVYPVRGVYDYTADNDLAILQIDGSGFQPLPIGTEAPQTGATAYALGAPLGLESTFSAGIISNPKRLVDGISFLQITTPISSGSSGGALLNDQAELIGITTAGFDEGQNLNLALPVGLVQAIRQSGNLQTLAELFPSTTTSAGGYWECPSVPDFGAYFGTYATDVEYYEDGILYYYADAALPYDVYEMDYAYYELLLSWGFEYIEGEADDYTMYDLYANSAGTVVLTCYDWGEDGNLYYSVWITP